MNALVLRWFAAIAPGAIDLLRQWPEKREGAVETLLTPHWALAKDPLQTPLGGALGGVEILAGARVECHWRPVFQSLPKSGLKNVCATCVA